MSGEDLGVPAYLLKSGAAYLLGGENSLEGYWGDKSSSVNFCEHDYEITPYVAEFWNTLSSAWIVFLPFMGLLFSNPLNEMRFKVAYCLLMVTGAGSMTLHATLNSAGQSCDEIPMLWMCSVIFYCLIDAKSQHQSGRPLVGWAVFTFVLVQTWIYFQVQSLYEVFIGGYVSMVLMIVFWTAKNAFYDTNNPTLRKLWIFSVGNYFAVGSSVWVLDMYYCDYYREYYKLLAGVTFHVIWHFSAGLATYTTILQLIFMRMRNLGMVPALKVKFGWLPVIEVDRSKKKIDDAAAAGGKRRSRRLASQN
jgi:dihydroceramidase